MENASDDVVDPSDDTDKQRDPQNVTDSDDLAASPSTTLVEVSPGLAVVFGVVPNGMELFDLGLVPEVDRAQLSTALGSIGNLGTAAGNVAEAIATAQGLYRVNDATLALLKNGGELAAKDGAKLGAIFKNGELIAQARFIPASMTAATAIAAIGPAVAMMALQMKLGEISELVRTNIALTTQTLRTIRSEQWAELEGLSEAVDGAFSEARELGSVTASVWEPVAPNSAALRKQLKLYRKNVAGHIQELGTLEGSARRQYLEANAEAIVFDTYALLGSLKTYAEYQTLRASLARARGVSDENEAQLFDRITRTTPPEIEKSLEEIRLLTASLVRELRIIAELPGRANLPLTKKRRDSKASRLTCRQLVTAVEPLANTLRPPVEMPAVPDSVSAPRRLDLNPYLRVLRWFLEDGEQLRGIAFPYGPGVQNRRDVVRAIVTPGLSIPGGIHRNAVNKVVDQVGTFTFVAVTDRRIITATPKTLLNLGRLGTTIPFSEVRYVRHRRDHSTKLPTISVTTRRSDIRWDFPADADQKQIDKFAAVIEKGEICARNPRNAIENSQVAG